MTNTVAFDPGLGELVIDFNSFINDVYSQLMNFQSIGQKRARFRLFNEKIYKNLENNIAFYLGCLLWAYYIKKNEPKNTEITGNTFINLTQEQLKEYDYLLQVNFIENYFDSYERDTLYYMGQKISIPDDWKKIVKLYKEFLELNKGFINTKTTNDLVLPKELSLKSFENDINSIILRAIKEKDLSIILFVEL